MSIKAFFGKGLMSLINSHQEKARLVADMSPRVATDMERMFGNCSPAVVAFRIENGFVVRTVNQEEAYEGRRQGGFTYCKDHQEIAEHIITSEAKRKLGIGDEYQQEMFGRGLAAQVQAEQQYRNPVIAAKSARI